MKSIAIALIVLLSAGLAIGQEVTVKGKTKTNTDFTQYQTFGWAKSDQTVAGEPGYYIYSYEERVPAATRTGGKDKKMKKDKSMRDMPYVYSYNVIIPAVDPSLNSLIMTSIDNEMEAKGYREEQGQPDLLVTYRVLERKARLKGYINDYPTMVGSQEVREPQDTVTYTLEPGTLMVSLIDRESGQVVWDGFASGLMQNDTFVREEEKVKQAVHLIFEEYKHRGDKLKTNN